MPAPGPTPDINQMTEGQVARAFSHELSIVDQIRLIPILFEIMDLSLQFQNATPYYQIALYHALNS